jgi:putative chitinase
MQIKADVLARITGKQVNDNMRSIIYGLDAFGRTAGLDVAHRLAHYIPQLAHESGAFRYDREVWGPTPAQARYDQRTDLGNTPEIDGDGKRNAGRGPIQITGGHNLREFTEWVRRFVDRDAPDFFANPELINTDPWEGLGPIWYWMTRDLNRYADANDIEMVTQKINGGFNGLADRLHWYTRTALVLLGFDPNDVKGFQRQAQLAGRLPSDPAQVDGVAGPKTRAALHLALVALSDVPVHATAAPVVVETVVPVPSVPEGAEKVGVQRTGGLIALLSPLLAWAGSAFAGLDQTGVFILLGIGLVGVVILLLRGEQIAARARAVIKSFEGIG